jgi:uncharacterized cupredoxin-like copper-binding protein
LVEKKPDGELSMKKNRMFAAAIAMAIATASQSHAGGVHGSSHGATAGEQGKLSDVSKTIQIDMYDNYYEPENIDVKKGETIRFVINNKGMLVHEFNIGTPEMHEGHQEEMLMMIQHGIIQGGKLNRDLMEMDMGNGQTMKHDDPNSALLAPGETAEMIWKFSDDGNIEYACNVPGHYPAGMYGAFKF